MHFDFELIFNGLGLVLKRPRFGQFLSRGDARVRKLQLIDCIKVNTGDFQRQALACLSPSRIDGTQVRLRKLCSGD